MIKTIVSRHDHINACFLDNVIRMAIVVSACTVLGVSKARAAEARLTADTPAAYAAAFTERTGDWKAGPDGFEGRGPLRREIPGTELGVIATGAMA